MSFIKKYSFRIGNGDENIENILESMQQTSRSQYIKDAIRFYAGLGSEIKQLNQHIKQLLNGDRVILTELKQNTSNESNVDILEASIEDLLEL